MACSGHFLSAKGFGGELIRGAHNFRSKHAGSVVTIGSFDGVHRGHQQILEQLNRQSKRLNLPSVVMIFEPQPHEFFNKGSAPPRLQNFREKLTDLFAKGADRVCCIPFNKRFCELTPEEFIQKILVDGLGTKYLVVGDDFRFGAKRAGDYNLLKAAGEKYDFEVTDTASFLIDNQRVSSTRIRALLQANDFEKAAELIGHPYRICGRVVKGQQLGRKLDAPTANIHLKRFRSPLSGVFAVTVKLPNGDYGNGVANVGVRPTVGGQTKPILEVHIFDCDSNLYGEVIEVEFKHKLREEIKFDGLEQLQVQIKQDMQQAREFFQR